ncbi:MAG: L,D-transpeptidase [Frankiaceae bacterium]|nr:L,D-transpeptidase [Frankiaceae bacterium]MBV9870376.1 L,D-transpeptidase [Frankiaceae bacterium]
MRRLFATVVLALVCGCSGQSATSTQAPPTASPSSTPAATTRFPSYAVTARVADVAIYASPHGRVTRRLANPTRLGVPLTFLLKRRVGDWLEVYLPIRPDGSTGWIMAGAGRVRGDPYRIDVHRRAHRLDLFKFDRRVRSFPIGVGTADTPTPGGVYYLKELLRPPDPHGFYGPYAFGLSGFSAVLHSFAGGNGVIGIHGTNDPASVGRSESHGCIRMRNAAISYLAHRLPLGTPVRILR